MPEIAPISQKTELPNLVQLIAQKGDEIPDEFIHKNGFPGAIDAPAIWKDNLIIDFSLLFSSSPEVAKTELAKFKTALTTWGCFQIVNHGMEESLLEEVIQLTKQFFELPLEEKMKSSSTYEALEGYSTDAICKMKQPTNWNDRLFLMLHPRESGNRQMWPENPQRFRNVVDEYTTKLVAMTEGIYKAMARTLNLEDEECFIRPTKDGLTLGRFTVYPRCPFPDQVLGTGPHLDGTTVTIILTNVEGLQVQKDDQWYKVPVISGALFVNVGDYIEVMTNGIFKSVMHRVVTNSTQDRTSIGAFCGPERNQDIEPLSKLISADQPALYKKFKAYDYLKIFYENFPLGRNAIDELKL